MQFDELPIPGCYLVSLSAMVDSRGTFVKTMMGSAFEQHGLRTDFVEEFYSQSRAGVLRGLHFQVPPADHAKLVYCIAGRVLDAFVDLRVGSPTFKQHCKVELAFEQPTVVYLPTGMAHGFLALEDGSVMVYKTTHEYVPESDLGVHWDSCGIRWPCAEPLLSRRDAAHPPLSDYQSPFRYLTGG